MKKIIIPLICVLVLGSVIYKLDDITTVILNTLSNKHFLVIKDGNEYKKDYDFKYVQNSSSMVPYSKADLQDLIFTIINNGWDQFTFYCPSEYTECVDDMSYITNDNILLAHINNYVHPYNSYDSLKTSINDSGEITVTVTKLYTEKQISEINTVVDKIISSNYDASADEYTNLKKIHDYIINNTKYDVMRNNTGDSIYKSYMAYGPAVEGYATCNGYADLMAIILYKLGYENFKVATTEEELGDNTNGHIWNAVKIDTNWLHIDLTWDDPVSADGSNYLYHKYFLVTTGEMNKVDNGNVKLEEHNFNKHIYQEFEE